MGYALMASVMVLASCTNDDFLAVQENPVETATSDFIKFKYQGVEYTAEYVMQDTVRVFKDAQIGNMLQRLENNPNSAIIYYPDGMVEYFDSTKDFEDYIKTIRIQETATTKAPITLYGLTNFTVSIYEHENYGGRVFTWSGERNIADLSDPENTHSIMLANNFDNLMTAFKFIGTVTAYDFDTDPWQPGGEPSIPPTFRGDAMLTFYDGTNYTGQAVSYVITRDAPQVLVSNIGKGFNDKASSLKAYWVAGK